MNKPQTEQLHTVNTARDTIGLAAAVILLAIILFGFGAAL
jgi:hypothetical protein